MINFRQLVSKLKKESRAGRSYQSLAGEYKVSKPEIGRIIAGHYPGPKIARVLGLRPKCPTCKRTIREKGKPHERKQEPEFMKLWKQIDKKTRYQIIIEGLAKYGKILTS